MYLSAPIQALYPGTDIEIAKGVSEINMQIQPNHLHAAGAMHGSVYFRLLDDAAFFAANSLVLGVFVLTTKFNIQLFRPCSSGVITSKGVVISQAGQSITAESKLYNTDNIIIALGSGTFVKSKIPLSREIGYS
jgi:uncharacterized protein (TIGR00369 family)